jgi:hypothetical protein
MALGFKKLISAIEFGSLIPQLPYPRECYPVLTKNTRLAGAPRRCGDNPLALPRLHSLQHSSRCTPTCATIPRTSGVEAMARLLATHFMVTQFALRIFHYRWKQRSQPMAGVHKFRCVSYGQLQCRESEVCSRGSARVNLACFVVYSAGLHLRGKKMLRCIICVKTVFSYNYCSKNHMIVHVLGNHCLWTI